jgi:hypothetical protein
VGRPRFLPVATLAGAGSFITPALGGGALVLALLACKADIPEGVYRCDSDEDCPHGFSCRADESGDPYCFSGSSGNKPNDDRDGGTGDQGGRNGGSGSSGEPAGNGGAGSNAGAGGAGSAARDGGAPPAELVPPTALGFSSGGERRTGPGLVLYDDGFERGGRDCSADGVLCVTGGFAP